MTIIDEIKRDEAILKMLETTLESARDFAIRRSTRATILEAVNVLNVERRVLSGKIWDYEKEQARGA